jgi:tol-pal system protein YbgF
LSRRGVASEIEKILAGGGKIVSRDVEVDRRRRPAISESWKEVAVRTRSFVLAFVAILVGAMGGAILAPQPAGAVSREIIELQQQVSQLLQGQQDLNNNVTSNNATLRTLVQQSLDAVNKLSDQMAAVQKSAREMQANTGSKVDTMTQQTQGISDNLSDVQARVGKLSQQLTDVQNLLQSIDSKVSGGAPGAVPGAPPSMTPANPGGPTNAPGAPSDAPPTGNPGPTTMNPGGANPPAAAGGMAPISADTLYQNGLRDFTSGNYDLAHQEFSDYIRNFPGNDLASNAQFYLGEISFAQGDYKTAIGAYDTVLTNYPHSFKLAASLYKKALAELEAGLRTSGTRDLREVVRQFPGTDEARHAQAKLREITPHTTQH